MPTCKGCNRNFSQRGYATHLAQTTRPACIAVREGYIHHNKTVPDNALMENIDDTPDRNPIPFEGDYFREYLPEEFDVGRDTSPSGPDPANTSSHAADGGCEEGAGVGEEAEVEGDADDDDDDYDDGIPSWEPPPLSPPSDGSHVPMDEDTNEHAGSLDPRERHGIESRTSSKTFVEHFPSHRAGEVLEDHGAGPDSEHKAYAISVGITEEKPFAPFQSKLDWELARWAKMRGPGATAVTDLLKIENLVDLLGLSYKTSQQLDQLIDQKLPSKRPHFNRYEITVAGEAFEVFARNIVQCLHL
ncbi:hypothetical protein DAEQUDRAFT_787639 [Daedalea quercina L-15889]|uniref:Uncharacterized protein n=1 Tax=Daedalea quercina L-15889 TaxID=1314783 RepID=A0A165U1I5_9APHY|nr:hypothetical protein DAEQUDRAFT_787639 [Daedalea quercina L-15889]